MATGGKVIAVAEETNRETLVAGCSSPERIVVGDVSIAEDEHQRK